MGRGLTAIRPAPSFSVAQRLAPYSFSSSGWFFITCITCCVLAASPSVFAKPLDDSLCASGTRMQLLEFFTGENLILFAEGVRSSGSNPPADGANVLFFIDRESERFYLLKLQPHEDNGWQACVFISAREVDFMLNVPVAGLIEPHAREHLLFFEEIPADAECPDTKKRCESWSQWSHLLRNTRLLSGYITSSKWDYDAYDETVDVSLEDRVITTTRGKLALFAREKFAARMRGAVSESEQERKAALTVYKRIHDEVDHHHPLLILWLTDNDKWAVSAIDRVKGLVWTPLHGTQLRIYPEPKDYYLQYLPAEQDQ